MSLATLSSLPSIQTAHEQALNWLNTNIPSFEDLERSTDLEKIVEETRTRSQELNSQLASSASKLGDSLLKTRSDALSHLQTAQEYSLVRHSLSDEVTYLSQDLVSSTGGPEMQATLLEDIESLHRNLKELESVKSYVRLIHHALALSEAAKRQARDFPSHSSVSEYCSLHTFVDSVVERCSVAEQTAVQHSLHLVNFLQGLRSKTWSDMKAILSDSVIHASELLKWPLIVDCSIVDPKHRTRFATTFLDLLKLQELGENLGVIETEGLYPIQALVQPIALRFKFHFEGTRQTNQLDKPEWYFAHIHNVAHVQRAFIESDIQPLLSATKYKNINAWREFVFLLLPLLTKKLRRSIPSLLIHPPLLAHTIYQAIAFDGSIRDEGFLLVGTSATQSDDIQWQGVSETVLGRSDWFQVWLRNENDFALDQYNTIIGSPDAWLIADDTDDTEYELKPTNSARRVQALIEQVTDRYSPLPNAAHRMDFLVSIQLPLLSQYQSRIASSLDAFETLSSAFVRAVPGALGRDPSRGSDNSTKRLTSGVEGVQRLCKALISSKYILNVLATWGEDLFFLELWKDIVQTTALRLRAEENSMLPNPSLVKIAQSEGTVFDELIVQYTTLSDRANEMVVHHIYGEVEVELREHLLIKNNLEQPEGPDSSEIVISSTLLPPISLLSSYLTFLQSILPSKALIDLYRRVASRLSVHLLQRMIMYRGRGRIGSSEARTIMNECELWLETCRLAFRSGGTKPARMIEGPWRRLVEAGRLVGAQGSHWEKIRDLTFGSVGDVEWENEILAIVGMSELTRDEVATVLRTRADCDR